MLQLLEFASLSEWGRTSRWVTTTTRRATPYIMYPISVPESRRSKGTRAESFQIRKMGPIAIQTAISTCGYCKGRHTTGNSCSFGRTLTICCWLLVTVTSSSFEPSMIQHDLGSCPVCTKPHIRMLVVRLIICV